MKILITSGGCKAPIDEVRHIGNFSSGRYGKQIAIACMDGENEIFFFHERDSHDLEDIFYPKATQREYKDYNDYLNVKTVISEWKPDIIIAAAAISDYIPIPVEGKISSDAETLTLTLKKTEKVIKSFRELAPDAYIVGFKLMVGPSEAEVDIAVNKVFDCGVDMVIFNDLVELRKGNSQRRLYRKEYRHNPLGYDEYTSVTNIVKVIQSDAQSKKAI